LLFEKSFGYAKPGEAMLYNNELMRVSIAVNQGSFVEQFGIGYGPEWEIDIIK
jgi:hypothetical protein